MLKKLIDRIKHRRFCKLNHYFAPIVSIMISFSKERYSEETIAGGGRKEVEDDG